MKDRHTFFPRQLKSALWRHTFLIGILILLGDLSLFAQEQRIYNYSVSGRTDAQLLEDNPIREALNGLKFSPWDEVALEFDGRVTHLSKWFNSKNPAYGRKYPQASLYIKQGALKAEGKYVDYQYGTGIVPPPENGKYEWLCEWKPIALYPKPGEKINLGVTLKGSPPPDFSVVYYQWPEKFLKVVSPENDPFKLLTLPKGERAPISIGGEVILDPSESALEKKTTLVLYMKFYIRNGGGVNLYYQFTPSTRTVTPDAPPLTRPSNPSADNPPDDSAPGLTGARLEIPDRVARQGQRIKVPLYLKGVDAGSGVANLNVDVVYDRSQLTSLGIDRGNIYGSGTLVERNSGDPGKMRVGFAGKVDIASDGVVAYLNARADLVSGEIPLKINVIQAQSATGQSVRLGTRDGTIYMRTPADAVLLPPDTPFVQLGPPGSGSFGAGTGTGSGGTSGSGGRSGGSRLPPGTLVKGDIDGDGRLTPADAEKALEMSVKLREEDLFLDLSGNNKVESEDARMILNRSRPSGIGR